MKTLVLVTIYLINVMLFVNCNAQNTNLVKTKETIVKYNFNTPISKSNNALAPIGHLNHSVIYLFQDDQEWNSQFYAFDEYEKRFNKVLGEITDSKQLFFFNTIDSIIFYREAFFDINDINDYGFSRLKLNYQSKTIILDSIFNADKKIHSSFSLDGKKLVVNTLNTLSDYYNPEQDDRFAIYSLEKIKDGKFTKEYIPCKHCSDGHLIGDNLFFSKSNQRDDFSGGFLWKDIYKAPLNDLNDTVKIAAFSNILAITPDGKYILATRHFDLPNKPCAIIDVENKKYQLLLGREYSKANAFYSYKKKKFAFDFEGRIVYVDFPKEYPFDALQKVNSDIPKWSKKEFYQQFLHKPFE